MKARYTQIMTTLKAHFDGQVLVPEQAIELPIGCILEVTVCPLAQSIPQRATLDLMKEWAREDEALSPEQRSQDARVFDEIEREGIARVRV